MSTEKYNKEQIRNRMLKYAAAFWGIKKGDLIFSDRPMKKFYCGEKKKAGVEISFRFRPWPGVFSVM